MKRAALAAAAMIAATLYGDGTNEFNMSLGSFALEGASNCTWNISLGAASMMEAQGVSRSVFLGNRAGQAVNAASNCVGIGWGALRNVSGTERATEINGQFRADKTRGTVAISPDPESPAILYSNGTLRVSGDLVVEGNVSLDRAAYAPPGGDFSGYDFYVDALRGDDEADGLSVVTPKQTLDGALSLVTNNGQRICVRAGTYAYPAFFKKGVGASGSSLGVVQYLVSLVGVDGRDVTFVANDTTNQAWVAAYLDGGMQYISGITFKGFRRGNFSASRGGAFYWTYFKDCAFADTDVPITGHEGAGRAYGLFDQCVLDGCEVRDCVFKSLNNQHDNFGKFVFEACLLRDSRVAYTTPTLASATEVPMIGEDTTVENCLFVVGRSYGAFGRYEASELGDRKVHNSTILIGSVIPSGNDTFNTADYLDTIYFADVFQGSQTDCYTNTYAAAETVLGADYRPTVNAVRGEPVLGFCGWGAASGIMAKNAIVAYVGRAIADSIPASAAEGTRNALLAAASAVTAYASQPFPAPISYDSFTNMVPNTTEREGD